MATFKIERLKRGYEDKPLETILAITDIVVDDGEKEIVLPDTFEEEVITHVGYLQDYMPPHEVWCDYHHPSKGSDYVEGLYSLGYCNIKLPMI